MKQCRLSSGLPVSRRSAFETPYGVFAVEANDSALVRLHFPGYIPADFVSDPEPSDILSRARWEVLEYIAGERRRFDIPLDPPGSPFQHKVWNCLLALKYGEVVTYGEVAKATGNSGAARAVGTACRNNPIPLCIPCHRVIGANGKLTGFHGGGLELKKRLIELESECLISPRS